MSSQNPTMKLLFLLSLSCWYSSSAEWVCPLADPITLDSDGLVTLEQVANKAEGTFTMRLTYSGGQSWVGIGINREGSSDMEPTAAVIGRILDGAPDVSKYDLISSSKDGSGVIPMGLQNLKDVKFEQTDTTSVLTFTQQLSDETVTVTDDSVWIYAVGLPDNQWAGKHLIHGAFYLRGMDELCTEVATGPTSAPAPTDGTGVAQPTEAVSVQPQATGDVADEESDEYEADDEESEDAQDSNPSNPSGSTSSQQSGIVQVASTEDETRPLWVAHGVLMALAWGVCAPLAIGAVLLRNVSFLSNKGYWFKIHFYLNICNILFTAVGFALAVVAIQKQGDEHFKEGTHTKAGLAIFVVALFQFALAFLRPDPPKAPSRNIKSIDNPADTDSNNSTPYDSTPSSGIEHAVNVLPPSFTGDRGESEEIELGRNLDVAADGSEQDVPTKSGIRLAWEISHRFTGIALIGLAWYNCTSGIQLQVENYGEQDDQMAAFWGVTAGISGFIFFLAYVVRV
eukprot:CAMPEP_0202496284 /NCGR_PEP_ID=MMETSP1361-20130828/19342_1 /ASSEMBLY_ACC=CAM_ASM_000849 /TAXON_ID=210615 /ORGANISM="Staurosira complex sp., Strain CCMP2646" /LENGTH=510 /DNA_ID=CAMNT_0049127563 /DNA_START=24 /DNA_END=1556 /DNA_ORIENTATION=-